MILVTGGAGFIGRAVLRRTTRGGYRVRTLLRPSQKSPSLPHGVPMEVALTSLEDPRGVRAALVGVETVLHLAGATSPGSRHHRQESDIQGTRTLAEAAEQAGVKRLIYLSHLGADRNSAYPLLRAKAEAEAYILQSGVPYTILRTSVVFGPGDDFTSGIAMLLSAMPFIFPLPGEGDVLLQPLWVDDLATAIVWALDDPATLGYVYEIGGPEYLTFREVVTMVRRTIGRLRMLVPTSAPSLRGAAWLIERILRRPPLTTAWLDYLAANRAADLGTLPRVFGLQPSPMQGKLEYLRGENWGWELLLRQFRRE